MADNILTKDRSGANLDIAAKDVAGVLVPRNLLRNTAGSELDGAQLAAQARMRRRRRQRQFITLHLLTH